MNSRPWMEAFALGDKIPEGTAGDWRVERRTITEDVAGLDRLRAAIHGHGRYVPPGTYTGLLCRGQVVMSDTPDEIADHLEPYYEAKRRGGRVLVHGLGLGVLLGAVLSLENVSHVDVVEISPEVRQLVGPAYQEHVDAGRLTIHRGDCFTYPWQPGTRWSVVWHDVWNTISDENLTEMTKLHRRFGRRADWQGSWCRYEYQRMRGY